MKAEPGKTVFSRGVKAAVLAGLFALCFAAGWVALTAPGGGEIWRSSLASGKFRYFLYLCGGCIVAFSVLVGVLARKRRKPMNAQAGAVILEFAMIFPIILMIVTLLLQSAFLVTGHLFVTYSVFCTARSAIVYIPTSTGEGRNRLADQKSPDISSKIWHIKKAAVWAVFPVGDGSYYRVGDDYDYLSEGLGDLMKSYGVSSVNWTNKYIGEKLGYAEDHTWIEIAPALENDVYGDHEDIQVFVTHDLYMAVPYASGVLAALDDDSVDLGDGKYAIKVHVECTMPNQGSNDEVVEELFEAD